ncbi:MAG: DUF4956 domain-containing protein [Eubacterium sp.]|nr:DUF4956 domain-containing protein [Eubacterium sp.]
MSIEDIIKDSDAFQQAITPGTALTIALDLLFALVMGILIYFVYKKYFSGVVYSRNYAITLIGMSVLTCMVTLAISTNIVISLGMVGALSIVRFRTAIKEPLDLMYLFWAITCGITAGASMYILAIAAFVIMFIVIVIFARRNATGNTYVMIVHYNGADTEGCIVREISDLKYNIRSKVERSEDTELTIQLQIRKNNLGFTEKIKALEEVKDVAVINFDGEYH